MNDIELRSDPEPIWNLIETYQFDEPGAANPFSRRLSWTMRGWSKQYAARVLFEYKRFICLAAVSPTSVTPSEAVDQAWHLHMIYSRNYADFCNSTLGWMLHHGPSAGGVQEAHRYKEQYEHTLNLYRQIFNEDPPADIWPNGQDRWEKGIPQVLHPEDFIILRKNGFVLLGLIGLYLTSILAAHLILSRLFG